MRTRFDQFAKDLWEEGVGDLATVTGEVEVEAGVQRADTVVIPAAGASAELQARGLLGRMVLAPCVIEAFHEAPDEEELRECARKYLAWRRAQPAEAALWVLSAGDPRAARGAFGLRAMRGWPRGCFTAPSAWGLRLVVVRALDTTRDTLALRLFGKGPVLRAAARELLALPDDAWERRMVPALLRWSTRITELPSTTPEEREDYMITGREMMEELLRRGREQGIAQGVAQGVAPLMRQLERRLERPLVAAERERVLARIDKLGPERVGDVVLDLAPAELAAWLADPDAQ